MVNLVSSLENPLSLPLQFPAGYRYSITLLGPSAGYTLVVNPYIAALDMNISSYMCVYRASTPALLAVWGFRLGFCTAL